MESIMNPGRRAFIKTGAAAGAGLTLAFYLPPGFGQMTAPGKSAVDAAPFAPNAFVRIGADNSVTVIVKHLEMGQGVYTGLPTLVAEELDADWAQIKVEGAPANAKLYNNLAWGPVQGTGASTSIANSFEQLRKAGAAARAMLVAAAAQTWGVPLGEITVRKGVVMARGHKATFGDLAAKAAQMPIPDKVTLKESKDFQYIGKYLPRKDARAKVDGTAKFTIDVKLPGMLTAVVAHPPLFGAAVKSFDASGAKAVKGVVDVVQIPSGVAVLAVDFWSAKKGRDALSVEWDESGANKLGSAEIFAQYQELAQTPGLAARKEGDAVQALAEAAQKFEAGFEFPYLAHAAMEPVDCVINLGRDACEVWSGGQFQTIDQMKIASVVGLKLEQIKMNMLYAGGSFGRRSNPTSDYTTEAAHIVKAIAGRAPVKLVWTREDDMRGGYYRPLYYHALTASLDANGQVTAWRHRIIGQSILAGTPLENIFVQKGIDPMSVEGAANLPYRIPNLLVELHTQKIGVPVLWWRSVGHTHNAFSSETFIDELAAAAGKDPVEFRSALLTEHPRHLGVLNLAAQKAGWGKPLPPGKGRGIALHESFNTFVAQVAEVTVKDDGSLKVDRVVCAVDCGIAVNPDIVKAQMEGGIAFGLAAALHGAITLKDGRVEQSNFHDYQPLRINEMPRVEVYIVPSGEAPTGVGEPGVPPIAPAVCNAIFAATGKRIRSLPISNHDLKSA